MNRGGKTLVIVLGSLVLNTGARALVSDSPYQGIVDRNVFSLKPLEPQKPPPAPPAPAVKLTLTGIITILGKKQALLSAQVPARPPEPARQDSYMLAEGQRDTDVEVLTIDEKGGTVKVNNHGTVETLDFVNNGAKLTGAAPPPGGLPPGAPPGMPMPGMPMMPNPAAGGAGLRSIPTRQMRSTPNSPESPGSDAQPNQGLGGVPSGMAASQFQNGTAQQQFQNNITPEEQTLMIEAQRLNLQQQGDHVGASMFPNTDATSEISPGP